MAAKKIDGNFIASCFPGTGERKHRTKKNNFFIFFHSTGMLQPVVCIGLSNGFKHRAAHMGVVNHTRTKTYLYNFYMFSSWIQGAHARCG